MDIISTFISEIADMITFVLASFGLITLLIIIDIDLSEKTEE